MEEEDFSFLFNSEKLRPSHHKPQEVSDTLVPQWEVERQERGTRDSHAEVQHQAPLQEPKKWELWELHLPCKFHLSKTRSETQMLACLTLQSTSLSKTENDWEVRIKVTCNYGHRFLFHFCCGKNFSSPEDNFRRRFSMSKGTHTVDFKEMAANKTLYLWIYYINFYNILTISKEKNNNVEVNIFSLVLQERKYTFGTCYLQNLQRLDYNPVRQRMTLHKQKSFRGIH